MTLPTPPRCRSRCPAGLGEAEVGAANVNIIPKTGGNVFSGSAFFSNAGEWSQGENLDDELRSFGITDPAALIKAWDVSGAFGGPIKRDRLWFFGNVRNFGQHDVIARTLCERQRRRRDPMGLPRGSRHPGSQRDRSAGVLDTSDSAGDAEGQARVLHRPAVRLHRLFAERRRRRVPGGCLGLGGTRRRVQLAGKHHDVCRQRAPARRPGYVDAAADQPIAARRRLFDVYQPTGAGWSRLAAPRA